MYWPLDSVWYLGDVLGYDEASGKHHVRYAFDGLSERIDLNGEEWATHHEPPGGRGPAHGTVDSAVEAIKQGAHDYITKPFDAGEMQAIIRKALATGDADRRIVQPDPTAPADLGRFGIIGRNTEMVAIFDLIGRVAASPSD